MSGVGGGSRSWRKSVQNVGDLPTSAADGDVRIVLSTDEEYEFDGQSQTWKLLSSAAAAAFTPSPTVTSETNYGQSPNPGVASTFSRGDHTHGTPPTDYVGFLEQTTLPTIVQIPTMKWAFWFNTSTSQQFIVRNRAGTMYVVELTAQP